MERSWLIVGANCGRDKNGTFRCACGRCRLMGGKNVPEDGFTYFSAKMDFEALDEKLKRFIMLRNELVMLAKEIGLEVSSGLLELKVK